MVMQFDGDGCLHSAVAKHRGELAAGQEEEVLTWANELAAKVTPMEQRAGDLPRRLRAHLREGRLAFVTGAGLSISCGLPSWYELVNDVFRQIMSRRGLYEDEIESTLHSVKFADDLLSLAQALTAVSSELDVASLVASRLYARRPNRSALLKIVGDVIEASLRHNRKSRRASIVLTFNYDTLLEQELRDRGVEVQSINRQVSLDSLPSGTVCIIHAHGVLDQNESGSRDIVFTEQSYGHAYLRDRGSDPLSGILEAGLSPLFVGFSFRDHFVRQILHKFSIQRNEPVAVGILTSSDLVDVSGLVVSPSASQGFTPNDRVGWSKTGKNPIKARQGALLKIPEDLGRWILYSVGIEWWKVRDRESLPSALEQIL
jgi:SIR2-like protein